MKIVVIVVGEDPEVALNKFALDSQASSGSARVLSKDESRALASRIIQDLAQPSPPEDMILRRAWSEKPARLLARKLGLEMNLETGQFGSYLFSFSGAIPNIARDANNRDANLLRSYQYDDDRAAESRFNTVQVSCNNGEYSLLSERNELGLISDSKEIAEKILFDLESRVQLTQYQKLLARGALAEIVQDWENLAINTLTGALLKPEPRFVRMRSDKRNLHYRSFPVRWLPEGVRRRAISIIRYLESGRLTAAYRDWFSRRDYGSIVRDWFNARVDHSNGSLFYRSLEVTELSNGFFEPDSALERYWPAIETAALDPWTQDLLSKYRKLFEQGRFGDIIVSYKGWDRDDQGNVIDQDSIEEYFESAWLFPVFKNGEESSITVSDWKSAPWSVDTINPAAMVVDGRWISDSGYTSSLTKRSLWHKKWVRIIRALPDDTRLTSFMCRV